MATILIVDDDKFTRNVLETIFTQDNAFTALDLTVATASDGVDGLARYKELSPDIVITDLLMPNVDGFALCKDIRAQPGGADVAIMVTSGVYRDAAVAQRLRVEYKAKFFAKPYQIKQLTQAVAKALGTEYAGRVPTESDAPAREASARSGDLSATSLPTVLFDLLDARATGVLTVDHGHTHKTLDLVLGHPVAATSNVREETLGHFLVQRGVIDDAQHRRALEAAAADRGRLGHALIATGALTSERLVDLLRAQVRHRIVQALRWNEGRWSFAPGPESNAGGEPLDLEEVIVAGLRETADADDAHQRVTQLKSAPLRLTDRGEQLAPRLRQLLGHAVGAGWSSGTTVRTLLARGDDRGAAELAIDAMFCAGLVEVAASSDGTNAPRTTTAVPTVTFGTRSTDSTRFTATRTHRRRADRAATTRDGDDDKSGLYGMLFGDAAEATRAGAHPLVDPEDDEAAPGERADPGESGVIDVSSIGLPGGDAASSGERSRARRTLLDEYLRLQGLDHYDILEVSRDASPSEIAGALAERTNKFSLTFYARFDLGRDYAKLEEIHRRYQLARDVLLDDDKRAAYDRELAGGDLGPSAPSLDAEIAYSAATGMLVKGDIDGALGKLRKAVQLAPNEPEYHAELGWAQFLKGRRTARAADDARDHLNHALRIDPDHARAHEYKGVITSVLGDDDVEAIFHLERALEGDPLRLEPLAELERCWRRRGELRPLERRYRRMLHQAHTHGRPKLELELWLKLGRLCAELDDVDGARAAYESAKRIAPHDATIRASLAALGSGDGTDDASDRLDSVREHWHTDPTSAGPGLEFMRVAQQANRHDLAFLAASALVAHGVANDEADALYRRCRPRFVMRAQRQLDDPLWDLLAHPDDDRETGALFDLLAPVFHHACPIRPEDLEIDESTVVPDEDLPAAFVRVRSYAAHIVGVPEPAVHVRADFGHELHVGALDPPVLIVGEDTLAAPERLELAFRLGRAMTYVRPGRAIGGSHPARMLKSGMLAALTAAMPGAEVADPDGTIADLRVELDRLDGATRRNVLELAQRIARRSPQINLSKWARSLARTADRAGLLLCGDLPSVARFARDCGTPETARELLRWAVSPAFAQLRSRMGLSIDV